MTRRIQYSTVQYSTVQYSTGGPAQGALVTRRIQEGPRMGATADIIVTKEVTVISALLSLCKHQPMDINMPPAQRHRPGLRANVALCFICSVQSFIPIRQDTRQTDCIYASECVEYLLSTRYIRAALHVPVLAG